MVKNKPAKGLIVFVLLLLASSMQAQTLKYLVLLKDKNNSPFSTAQPEAYLSKRAIQRRQTQGISLSTQDLPVNPAYTKSIQATGAKVWYTSRWMNAVLIEATTNQLNQVLALSFVKGIEGNRPLKLNHTPTGSLRQGYKFATEAESPNFGLANTQNKMLGVDVLHQNGYTGEGILIGVLDSGFQNASAMLAFNHLFTGNKIVATYDFVQNEKSVYEDDTHGTHVLSCLAAQLSNTYIGTAPQASYLLLRTEDVATESVLEEVNWLVAAEYADSVGVDMISSSLGYTTFDDASTNHTYSDLNGKTTIVARAATWAAAKGIICVVSAGNEGADAWRYIGSPADADSILAVGAVNSLQNYAIFSSIGPSADGRIKPDVVAMGQSVAIVNTLGSVSTASGTSFSAPILCGMVADLWQASPKLKAQELITFVKKSGNLYNSPTAQLGYGIPSASAVMLMNQKVASEAKAFIFPNPTTDAVKIILNTAETSFNYPFRLIDHLGNTVMTGNCNSAITTLSLAQVARGMFFLKISLPNEDLTLKIIKN